MFKKLIARIAGKLTESNIPYMIIGGQAVLVYGEPRLTKDIDITLGIGVNEAKKIIEIVNALNLEILIELPEQFINETMVLPVLDGNSNIKVDFIFSFTPYEREAIKRAKKVKLEGVDVNFASLEDVIIHKIFAGRARDLEDVKIVLLKNKSYDRNYILGWLQEFDRSLSEDFSGRFQNILKEI